MRKGTGWQGVKAKGTACAQDGNVHIAGLSEEHWAAGVRSDHDVCVQNRGWGRKDENVAASPKDLKNQTAKEEPALSTPTCIKCSVCPTTFNPMKQRIPGP